MNNSMILVTSSWNKQRTFKMIPTIVECPYNECIFDPENNVLAIVSKEYKKNFQMVPALDMGGQPVKDTDKRVKMDTYYEYFIEDQDEIIQFIQRMGANSASYDFKTILNNSFSSVETV